MRYRIWKNFPDTFEMFLLLIYTCIPNLRHLIGILSKPPLPSQEGICTLQGHILSLLPLGPSTQTKESMGSRISVDLKPMPPTS